VCAVWGETQFLFLGWEKLSEQLLLTRRGKCCSAVQEEQGKERSLFCLTLPDHRKRVQTLILGMMKSS